MIEMSHPQWISKEQTIAIHDMSIHRFGGADGIRDEGLLHSALARPENHFAYGERNVFVLAAIYAHGIALNHPFVDGNKRTAFSVAGMFLFYNGFVLDAQRSDEHITMFMALAAGKVTQSQLASYLQKTSLPRPS